MIPAVLIVDDRPENLLTLEAVLAPLGAHIARADSGEAALRAVLAGEFAAILLDVEMPGMDGFETAALIRGRDRSAHTPIIFLTARTTDMGNVARGYEAGAVDFVVKPFDPLVLKSKVAVFCDLARQRTAREQADRLLRAAWEGAPNGIALVDPDGTIAQANPALLHLTGRAGDELPAHVDALVTVADRPALAALRERVASGGGGAAAVELRLETRSGEEIPVAVLASAVPAADGALRTLLLQVSDLRERLRAQEASAALVHEQAARAEADEIAGRLGAIAAITEGLEGHTTAELVPELCARLMRVLGLSGVAVRVLGEDQRLVAEAGLGAAIDELALDAALSPGAADGEIPPSDDATVLALRVDGRLLGAVAVAGLDADDPGHVRTLALLRNAVERAALMLERARLFERERTIAATLQRDLLPETLPAVPGIAVSAYFSSGGDGVRVGGDWYDALALPGGRLGLVVGDVAGHGVAAAARMGELRSVARAYALEGHGPAELLQRMNAYHLVMGSETMTTLVVAVVEPDRGRARFASAGHMPPLLVPAPDTGTEPHFLDALGPPLGVLEVGNYEEREVALPPGAMLALYTDGLVERRGEVLDLGLERLRGALAGAAPRDVHAARTQALDACLEADGAEDDDVTAVFVRAQERLGSPASYTLTPEAEALGAMRRQVRRWLEETGAEATEAAEITIAANEAMQNAIEHGNAYAVAPITVTLDLRGDDVVIVVRDLGHDGSRLPDPDRGRGIELMSALMDDARVDLGGPMGGAVTLRRRLARTPLGAASS